MAEIKFPEGLPGWFKIDRYAIEPASEQDMHDAVEAVIDRLQFYQSITAQSFNLPPLDGPTRDAALAALEEWSDRPYQRSTSHWRGALRAALCPTITADDVAAFDGILEREEEGARAASQQEMMDAVESVSRLPPEEQRLGMEAEIRRLREAEGEEAQQVLRYATGQTDGLKPVPPAWLEKLFTRRIAAYLDLSLWAALEGHTIDVEGLHAELFPEGSDPRSVSRLLEGLRELQHLRYRMANQDGRAFHAYQKNRKRRNKHE
ncbi:hypothetical protein [Halomonas sp. 25-S5]|uniref:hypothetical protein n=1 Tax=Halomonas sp. 25-S5 TaxID=2994065 RepID=UPI0024693872|nr:hypothetical protein [Halomonas sp. 25-S5]